MPKDATQHLPLVGEWIAKKWIQNETQISAAMSFLKKNRGEFTEQIFKEACGVGIEVTDEDIQRMVSDVVFRHREQLLRERYYFNQGLLLKEIRESDSMKWADLKKMKVLFDAEILTLLGPKTEADSVKRPVRSYDFNEIKKHTPAAASSPRLTPSTPVTSHLPAIDDDDWEFEGEVLKLHKPGENPQLNEQIRRAHLDATGGKVHTRFPPEPNGFLHIGHAKAINFDFRYAKKFNGNCYLRFDDTNPEGNRSRDHFIFLS